MKDIDSKEKSSSDKVPQQDEVMVDLIGLSAMAKGGFAADTDLFLKYMPKHNIDLHIFGYTKVEDTNSHHSRYTPILTSFKRTWAKLPLLVFLAPFLPIRKKAIITTNRIVEQLGFILFYPRHRKVCRLTGQESETLKFAQPKTIVFIYNMIEKLCIPFIDKYIVLDKITENYLKNKHNIADTKICIIPTGVDLAQFNIGDKKQAREEMGFKQSTELFLYAGRLDRVKNIRLLLAAFRSVREIRPKALLVLAGTGKEEEELKKVVSSEGINDVMFLGYITRDSMPVLMNCADIFVLSSFSEGSPNVIKEAIACGLPVVSTDVGDVSTYVHNGVNGYIVNDFDPMNFASNMMSAIENKESLRMGCLKTRGELSIDRVVERYAEFYRKFLFSSG